MHIDSKELAYSFSCTIEECIDELKQYAGNYNGKQHYDQITASIGMKASRAVDELVYSNSELKGFFLMPDEISTVKLASYLYKKTGSDM